jgi:hypothetical protein
LFDFNQIWIFWKDFHKKSRMSNFTEIRPVGAALQTDGRTDTTKLAGAIPDYATAPKENNEIKTI